MIPRKTMVTAPLAILAALTALVAVAPAPPPGELPPTPAPVPAVIGEEYYLWLGAWAGQGRWTDSVAQDAEPGSLASLWLTWRFRPAQTLRLDLEQERYRRTWVSSRIDPSTGQGERTTADERRWTAELGYAFDVLWRGRPGPWALEFLASAGLQVFDSPVVDETAIVLGGGLRVSRRFGETSRLFAEAMGLVFVGATDPGADSIAGAPRASIRARAGATFSPAPALEVELAWRGERIAYGHGWRQNDAILIQAAFGL